MSNYEGWILRWGEAYGGAGALHSLRQDLVRTIDEWIPSLQQQQQPVCTRHVEQATTLLLQQFRAQVDSWVPDRIVPEQHHARVPDADVLFLVQSPPRSPPAPDSAMEVAPLQLLRDHLVQEVDEWIETMHFDVPDGWVVRHPRADVRHELPNLVLNVRQRVDRWIQDHPVHSSTDRLPTQSPPRDRSGAPSQVLPVLFSRLFKDVVKQGGQYS